MDRIPDSTVSPVTADARVTAFFREPVQELAACIRKYPAVYGCLAWATHPDVLEAMAERQSAIILQKEDFLRPDGATNYADVRALYKRITANSLYRDAFDGLRYLSVCGSPEIGVRAVGYLRDRRVAPPRMHHKFLVFADIMPCHVPDLHDREDPLAEFCERGAFGHNLRLHPVAVWTGSVNPSRNATRSRENGVFIESPEIAAAYTEEFEQVAAMSEPLDWMRPYIEPDWREGT